MQLIIQYMSVYKVVKFRHFWEETVKIIKISEIRVFCFLSLPRNNTNARSREFEKCNL